MKIAEIAPLYEPIPPPLYGGTERVGERTAATPTGPVPDVSGDVNPRHFGLQARMSPAT